MSPEEAEYTELLGKVTVTRRRLGVQIGLSDIDKFFCPVCYLSGYDECHRVSHGATDEKFYRAFSCGRRTPKKDQIK